MGQIVNLMSVDAQKIQDSTIMSTLIVDVPVLWILSTYFLWGTVGPSAMAGFGVLAVLIPLNSVYFAEVLRKLQVLDCVIYLAFLLKMFLINNKRDSLDLFNHCRL